MLLLPVAVADVVASTREMVATMVTMFMIYNTVDIKIDIQL